MIRYARYAGLAIVFAWFFFGGVSHFTNVDFFMAIMPPYVPFPLAAVYVSGVFEVLFAIGILIPGNARMVRQSADSADARRHAGKRAHVAASRTVSRRVADACCRCVSSCRCCCCC